MGVVKEFISATDSSKKKQTISTKHPQIIVTDEENLHSMITESASSSDGGGDSDAIGEVSLKEKDDREVH